MSTTFVWLSLLGLTASPWLEVKIDTACPGIDASKVREIVHALSDTSDEVESATAQVHCRGTEVDITLKRDTFRVTRRVQLLSPTGSPRERELALLLIETKETLRLPPPRPKPAPPPISAKPEHTPAPPVPAAPAPRVDVMAGPALWLDTDGAASQGLGAALAVQLQGWTLSLDLAAHWNNRAVELGRAQAQRLTAGLDAGRQLRVRAFDLAAGLGLRGGVLRVSGDPNQGVDADNGSTALFGSYVWAAVAWRIDATWALQLEPEVGLWLRGGGATAADEVVVDVSGIWARAGLSVVVSFE